MYPAATTQKHPKYLALSAPAVAWTGETPRRRDPRGTRREKKKTISLSSRSRKEAENDGRQLTADNPNAKHEGDGQSSLLVPIREGGDREHEDERDGVGRNGVELGFSTGVSESFDDRRKEGRDGSEAEVHARVDDGHDVGLPVDERAEDGLLRNDQQRNL